MVSPASPAETRAFIIERLVGDTGEPDRVISSAKALTERSLSAVMQGLNGKLASPLDIEVQSVELGRFAQARPSNSRHAMTIAASVSSPDALILSMDPAAVALVVHALFGGDVERPVQPIDRDLSPTEAEVATMVFEEIAKAMNGTGPRAFEFRLPLPAAITGGELKRHILRDGPAVRVVFSISAGVNAGLIVLTMPQRVLLKHRGDAGVKAENAEPEAEWQERFGEEVRRSTVTLEATLPVARMTLGEIALLQEGQIIELEEAAQSQARLSARNMTLFVCEFGKLGQNYTVRIRHPFDAGQDLMDTLLPE
ncbi:FliM/FliN family flagellar motor switch protein [Pseudaminobacter soli (ex Li et al. 2025)]|uniref:Flagellar motor switch protein FliM n=1 Tax=Pseudaminobacter soli (ex Li et al. 2025) TaxID=1295366 RepID=A0A2P7SDX0_9HYPH|nr:FliM/FliN family flagellar motor switch protein [Mesorhizobium soli]PSJ60678.1 flagellar motor switch protein FliM [Mesorhizobium soli]